MRKSPYISWVVLIGAIAAFFLVAYQAEVIRGKAHVRASQIAEAEQKSDKGAFAERTRAIIAETQEERAELEAFAHLDIIKTVELLEAAGKSAGVTVTVANATAETGIVLSSGERLQPVAIAVNASGTYGALTHLIELYERLPLAAQIQQLDLDRSTNAKDARTWNLSMRLRILALAPSL